MPPTPIHVETPIVENPSINHRLGKRIFFKMECYQPIGSFKARGIGHLCQQAVEHGQTHLIASSGGNAGYAAAYAGRRLGAKVTVVVPDTTPPLAQERIRAEGAEVIVHGSVWDEADAHARQLVAQTGAAYIHPFDNPIIWEGHATLIEEAVRQSPKPGVIVSAVGGGGLLIGLLEGMERYGWADVPVLAVETEGADSFAASVRAGKLVTLPAITSVAKTLGAMAVAPEALNRARRHRVIPVIVSDRSAVRACLRFADDLRAVVEPACGAALSLVYDHADQLTGYDPALIVVCGGAGVTVDGLRDLAERLG